MHLYSTLIKIMFPDEVLSEAYHFLSKLFNCYARYLK